MHPCRIVTTQGKQAQAVQPVLPVVQRPAGIEATPVCCTCLVPTVQSRHCLHKVRKGALQGPMWPSSSIIGACLQNPALLDCCRCMSSLVESCYLDYKLLICLLFGPALYAHMVHCQNKAMFCSGALTLYATRGPASI